MFQIRIHGRGGQGVVSGAEMLSIAAFRGTLRAGVSAGLGCWVRR
jgi:pyruvate ferredoxin oxidoreductase gamma subunit